LFLSQNRAIFRSVVHEPLANP